MTWMLLVLLYGLLKGAREIFKKKALGRNTVMEVLFLYTLISFALVLPTAPKAMGLDVTELLLVALKSFVIFVAWICSFHAIKKLPISLYGILDLSRVLFATLLGVIFLRETMSVPQVIGLGFVCLGLLMLKGEKRRKRKLPVTELSENSKKPGIYIVIALLSCLLNGVSGTMDKVLMKDMNSTQLQFWYMLFLVLMYLAYILITRTKLSWRSMLSNQWVWILSVCFVIADRALFLANGMPESKVTIMTLIKQSGCLVTILGGKYVFKEEKIGYKLVCAAIVIVGIVIAVL